MQLKPFLLDEWLDEWEHRTEFNLGASTGPAWTFNQVLALADEDQRKRFYEHNVLYGRPAGSDNLRLAIAAMHGVDREDVQVVTGASEALLVLFWLAAEPGANVVLPRPGFTTFSALPESLGMEARFYGVRREAGFRIDIEEIKSLADDKTKLILVNSPHNPTGATVSDAELDELHEFTASHGMQLISDEVYHPIFHEVPTRSASRLPHATVIHDLSEAFPLSGTRVGWMIDRNPRRRKDYWTARSYFSITNSSCGELLAEFAINHRDIVLERTQKVASRNLRLLRDFMAEHRDILDWIPPRGGMTAFPWMKTGEDSRVFCRAAAERGVVLAPGDCFDAPEHFRIGFGARAEGFSGALDRLGEVVASWAHIGALKT